MISWDAKDTPGSTISQAAKVLRRHQRQLASTNHQNLLRPNHTIYFGWIDANYWIRESRSWCSTVSVTKKDFILIQSCSTTGLSRRNLRALPCPPDLYFPFRCANYRPQFAKHLGLSFLLKLSTLRKGLAFLFALNNLHFPIHWSHDLATLPSDPILQPERYPDRHIVCLPKAYQDG